MSGRWGGSRIGGRPAAPTPRCASRGSRLPTVLFVAHTFPPAGGSGSYRALAFACYLPENGWRPVVLTPEVGWAANRDDRLLGEVPPELKVVRTKSLEPRPAPSPGGEGGGEGSSSGSGTNRGGRRDPSPGLRPASPPGEARTARRPLSPASAGLLRHLRSHLGHARRFPDVHAGWTPFAIAAGFRAIRQHRVELIYSTAAPFTDHVVGLALHRLTGLPWVLELRDGWYRWNRAVFPDYPAWRDPLERGLEAAAIRCASRVVLVTQQMADAFRRQYADLPFDHFVTIPNGFDPSQVADVEPVPRTGGCFEVGHAGAPRGRIGGRSESSSTDGCFEVVHAGALYYGRSIDAFLEAAGRLAAADPELRARFRLTLVGTLDGRAREEVARQVERHGLQANVVYRGYVEHAASLATMRGADLLLLLVNTTPGAEATVPGKLYEYLAAGRPVLAVVPPGAEAAEIVERTRAGWVAPAHDPEGIRAALANAWQAHRAGALFAPDAAEVACYDRRVLTADLARLFDAVVEEARARRA